MERKNFISNYTDIKITYTLKHIHIIYKKVKNLTYFFKKRICIINKFKDPIFIYLLLTTTDP